MANVLIEESTMSAIGNAIREKTGKTDLILPKDMPTEIEGIESGGSGGGQELLDAIIDRSITEFNSSAAIVGKGLFYGCESLATVDFPLATAVGGQAFYSCNSLATVNIPLATGIGISAFEYCSSLTKVNFPSVTEISTEGFQHCVGLVRADFSALTKIGSYCFRNNEKLTSLILRNVKKVCELANKNAFNSTPITSGTGHIYVPSALLEDYKAATNWSTFAAQFRALEDYTVDGTITGELDETKISA